MPVISVNKERLKNLVDEDLEVILEKIPMIGADIERKKREEVDIEFFPNRPDLFSVEGIARAMRGYLEKETGLAEFDLRKSDNEILVDRSVAGIRSEVVGAVVTDLELDEESLTSIVNLQEHLHWGLGRDREKVSIGLHDLDKINSPFTYKAVDPEEIEFVPLGFKEEMNLDEILRKHKKGQKFGKIIKEYSKYPIIVDSNNQVLSFPPIINGTLTEVDTSTTDVFIDVTGTDKKVSEDALNILVTALDEVGGKIHTIKKRGNIEEKTPNLDPKTKEIDLKEVKELTGLYVSKKEVISALRKMRFDADVKEGKIKVKIPPYRSDILHKWDIIEDIAIGYGYENIDPEVPNVQGIGEPHDIEKLGEEIREIMIGHGYQEAMTLTLTNKEEEFYKVNRKERDYVPIKNPISEEHTIFRTSLLPSLLSILEINKHRNLPQKIFEFGEVEHPTDNLPSDCYHLAAVSLHTEAGFTEIKSLIQSIFNELNLNYDLEKSRDKLFLKGRRANLLIDNKEIGVFGEVNPDVITGYDLKHPSVALEIEIQEIM